MQQSNYWLDLFSIKSWQEFIKAGGTVSGFSDKRWSIVQKIKPGDFLLCYLTGVSRFIGALEVESTAFQDDAPIWTDSIFPSRLKVKIDVQLTPETSIPVESLFDKLSFTRDMRSPYSWTGRFRGSPALWDQKDGITVYNALCEGQNNPIARPIDQKKVARAQKEIKKIAERAPIISTPPLLSSNAVIINNGKLNDAGEVSEVRAHVEIQHRLLKLGSDMGFSVWVARNDRNREINGKRFSELFTLRDNLPLQFDEKTTRTIELIDVLWLSGNAIVAAFEVESTTTIYSGLLRMSDLIARQPNINIPLYLVAPEERREKVRDEVNRPTFSRFYPPLAKVCRYVSFKRLQDSLDKAGDFVRFLKPEFLFEISESLIKKDE